MTDSSLTTLPHLKGLYYTHMDGLAVSGSHGLREYTLSNTTQDAMLVPDCTLSNPLSYYEVGHRHVPKLVSGEGNTCNHFSLE
jgi:hypothetical protein